MTKVARSSASQANNNLLRVHRVKLFFQLYPGTSGTTKDRNIGSELDYELYLDGEYSQSGVIKSDGSIELLIPSCENAVLKVLGTDYQINPMANLLPFDTTAGAQQRLFMLGYFQGDADGFYNSELEKAVLNFQADNNIEPVGYTIDQKTYEKIKKVIGA